MSEVQKEECFMTGILRQIWSQATARAIENTMKMPASSAAEPPLVANEPDGWLVGRLATLSDGEYPQMPELFVQIWDGRGEDAVLVDRFYGNTHEQARGRAIAACRQSAATKEQQS